MGCSCLPRCVETEKNLREVATLEEVVTVKTTRFMIYVTRAWMRSRSLSCRAAR